MAHISSPAPISGPVSTPLSTPVPGRVRNILARIGQAFVTIGESNAKLRQANALMAMTDAELADRGLRRDQIARYVFGNGHWM